MDMLILSIHTNEATYGELKARRERANIQTDMDKPMYPYKERLCETVIISTLSLRIMGITCHGHFLSSPLLGTQRPGKTLL